MSNQSSTVESIQICQSTYNPTVYIVTVYGGQYEDHWSKNLAVSFEKEVAEACINDYLKEIAQWKEKESQFDQLIQNAHDDFLTKNPEPEDSEENSVQWTLWSMKYLEAEEKFNISIAKQLNLNLEAKEFIPDDPYDNIRFNIEEVKFIEAYDSFGR